jgi:hypothetical protein
MTDFKNISTRQLIADDSEIERKKQQLQLVDKDNENWTETYLDRDSGDKWLYYRVDSYLHGGGYPILGRLPLPDTIQLIDIALFSDRDDEIFAACRTLTDNEEIKKIDFRETLVNRLESIKDNLRQEKVIKLTGLDSALNRRGILGKTINQLNSDSEYFESISARAAKLKKK